LHRSIDNGASMTGIALFTDLGGGWLDYRERGQLSLPGSQVVDAERRYVFEEDAHGFSVWFAETPPRLFHRVVLSRIGPSLAGEAAHLCGDDRYDSRYEFRANGSFIIAHTVSGPRKSYAMETRYVRALI
jgi:Family of unknown function (DUF6314)